MKLLAFLGYFSLRNVFVGSEKNPFFLLYLFYFLG